MEVEKSLNRGTEKSSAFSHLLLSNLKCKRNISQVLCCLYSYYLGLQMAVNAPWFPTFSFKCSSKRVGVIFYSLSTTFLESFYFCHCHTDIYCLNRTSLFIINLFMFGMVSIILENLQCSVVVLRQRLMFLRILPSRIPRLLACDYCIRLRCCYESGFLCWRLFIFYSYSALLHSVSNLNFFSHCLLYLL